MEKQPSYKIAMDINKMFAKHRGVKNKTLFVNVVYNLRAHVKENESILTLIPILHKTALQEGKNRKLREDVLTEFKNSRACDTTISVFGHFTK